MPIDDYQLSPNLIVIDNFTAITLVVPINEQSDSFSIFLLKSNLKYLVKKET